ncbi:MAG: cobalamin biosynthesis protein CbiX [Gammaproteobacteria bacterium]|nr:MAG: cobalamin biosynthesis protein CbiX [Gammaproteobacteria bacterium]
MMKAVVLVAHGSRREASNEEVRSMARQMAERSGRPVVAAFLELAEPSIPDGIVQVIDAGADEVVVVPHFLSAGRHVSEDIPAEVERARALRPDARIRLADYLGRSERLLDALLELADAG